MPKPNPGEPKKDYLARFMRSGEAQSDFPDEKQRLAVAYSMYEKKNAGPFGTAEHPWPKKYSCSFIEPGLVFYQDLGPCSVCGDKYTCGEGQCKTEGAMVLVAQEALARMAQSFVGRPVIDVIHKDVAPSTVADGDADGIVTRVWLDDKSGWWMAEFLVWNPETQSHCESPAYSVSCAYEPSEVDSSGGEHHNIPYAEQILNGEYTHLAIVTNPRYEGARIFVNSKGGKMSWRFWTKGERKNAAPLDPSKEMVNVDGKDVPLSELYDAMDDLKSKYNDDTVLETPKGEKTLGELKQAYRNRMKKNAEALSGEHIKTSAPADAGHAEHDEGKGGYEHGAECSHCKHPAFNGKDGEDKPLVEKPLPDLRDSKDNPSQAEAAAKALDAEVQEKRTLELQQAEDKKKEEDLKNAADAEAKAAEEKRNAEETAEAEKREATEKRNAGRRHFEALRNARGEAAETAKIKPVSIDDRLAKGKSKYGSAA